MSLLLLLPRQIHLCRSSSNDQACHRYFKTHTIGSLLTRNRIHCACHKKWHLNVQNWSDHVVFLPLWLRATASCTSSTAELPKVLREWCVFNAPQAGCTFWTVQRPNVIRQCSVSIFASQCASGHTRVHFLNIAVPKSAPELKCFARLDFKLCVAPQQHALFPHRNFQKCSKHGVLCTFWFQKVLRATTACNSSSLSPQMAPHPPL